MRHSHSVFFLLFTLALFIAGCSDIGSSTGPASEGEGLVAADKSASIDTTDLTGSPDSIGSQDASDSLKTAVQDTVAPPPADTGSPQIPSSIPSEVSADSSRQGDLDRETPDSLDSALPVVQTPIPDTTTAVAVSIPGTESLAKPIVADSLPSAAIPALLPSVVPSVLPPANTAPASRVFLNTDFESENQECWNGNRTATAANSAGCGQFKTIGFTPFSLGRNGITHSGTKAIDITYTKNEEMGGTNVAISSDSVNVRAWYYFEPGFDFGQGVKIGRISSFNNATQLNDVDIILGVRSSGSKNQCGMTDMADVGMFYNGAPKGYDWGNAAASISFQRGRWYAVEYQVVLNAPGRSDGAVRLWVDGQQVAVRTGLNIRGTAGMDSKLNTVKIGGWYSNGANGNSACAHPSQPSTLHMDDVAIATSYVGLGDPNTVAAR